MSPKPAGFSKTLYVGWGDLDANGHMRNTAYLDKARDEKIIARVKTTGGWLDLEARKLTAPPEKLHVVLETAPRTEDFSDLALLTATGAG